MAQDLQIFEPIPLPSNPARLPSLPVWLQQRSAALASAVQPDRSGKYRSTPILPKAMILTSSERSLVQRHIGDLERFTRLDQPIELRGATLTNDQAHGVMIASLLLKGGAKLDQQSSNAITEDYLDAMEDLPGVVGARSHPQVESGRKPQARRQVAQLRFPSVAADAAALGIA